MERGLLMVKTSRSQPSGPHGPLVGDCWSRQLGYVVGAPSRAPEHSSSGVFCDVLVVLPKDTAQVRCCWRILETERASSHTARSHTALLGLVCGSRGTVLSNFSIQISVSQEPTWGGPWIRTCCKPHYSVGAH